MFGQQNTADSAACLTITGLRSSKPEARQAPRPLAANAMIPNQIEADTVCFFCFAVLYASGFAVFISFRFLRGHKKLSRNKSERPHDHCLVGLNCILSHTFAPELFRSCAARQASKPSSRF